MRGRTVLGTALAAIFLAVLAVGPWRGEAALADDGATAQQVGSAGTTLSVLPLSNDPSTGTWTLSVRLAAADGAEPAGVPVRFLVFAPIFGGRLMDLGEVPTDASGIASLVYRPTWTGSHTAVVRFEGTELLEPVETTLNFESDSPPHLYHDSSFGIESIRSWLPFAAIGVVLMIWGTLGYVMASTVMGVRAGRERTPWEETLRQPTVQPSAFPKTSTLTRVILGVILLGIIAAVVIALLLPGQGSEPAAFPPADGPDVIEPLPDAVVAVELVREVDTRIGGAQERSRANSADLPADIAVVADRLFILDTNNGRVMAVTPEGVLTPTKESTALRDIFFKGSTAMVDHEGLLYVANAIQGTILVITPEGGLEKEIHPQVPEGELPIRPSGVAVSERGEIWLSDEANHRVFLLSEEGGYIGLIGTGAPSSADEGFNRPTGLALDEFGNIYVADTGNAVVKKFSPLGVYLATLGEGILALPHAVAIDEEGRVLVSDSELGSVLAFSEDGTYLGCVSTGSCTGEDHESQFAAPHGIKVYGDLLYVMDRLAGVLVFELQSDGAGQ